MLVRSTHYNFLILEFLWECSNLKMVLFLFRVRVLPKQGADSKVSSRRGPRPEDKEEARDSSGKSSHTTRSEISLKYRTGFSNFLG
jgi:hypothetical protein